MTRGQDVRDLLVIHPVESMWMFCNRNWLENPALDEYDRMLVGLRDSLLAAHIDFDYGDEDILARHGKAGRRNGEAVLRVGKAKYKAVVVPPLITMRGTTLELLEKFKEKGGTIIFAGSVPKYLDALESRKTVGFADGCLKIPAKGADLAEAVQPICRRVSITDKNGKELVPVLYLLREDKDNFYIFICNVGHDFSKTSGELLRSEPAAGDRTASFGQVRVRGFAGCIGNPQELDPETGKVYAADAKRHENGWEIQTSLPVIGSRLFMVPKEKSNAVFPKRKKLRIIASRKINPPMWNMVLSECNNLVLDRPKFQIGQGTWCEEEEILRIDRQVREALGLPYRGGEALQPWAREKIENPPSVPVKLSFYFEVKVVPSGDLFIGMERPELYHVSINGMPICTDADHGWWVDKSLRKIPLDPALLKSGENKIEIGCDYNENHPGLETIYLLGHFGTKVGGTKVALVEMPEKLRLGDWTKQGLSFYSGAVGYQKTIMADLSPRQRMFVRVPEYDGSAVRVWVNGKPAGIIAWEPNEVEITDLLTGQKNELMIEVFSHRRNSHGPLHRMEKKATGVSPASFMTSGKFWNDEYSLVPCGLTKAPMILIKG